MYNFIVAEYFEDICDLKKDFSVFLQELAFF